MRPVKIAAVSFLVEEEIHPLELNFEKCIQYIRQAKARSADILCLPENVVATNVQPELESAAEQYPGLFTNFFRNAAREFKMNLVVPYLVRAGRRTYNQATVFDREGETVGYYRKLQPNGAELKHITPGDELPVFQLDCGRIAVMMCLDIYFPEIARIYALKGAEIIFWPTITHGPTQEALLTQLRARAADNSVILVESNLAGHPPYAPYAGRIHPGNARIVDPNGDILAQTGRRHGVAIAEVDLDEVRLTSQCVLLREPDRTREDLFRLMRTDLYAAEYAALAKRRKKSAAAPARKRRKR